jgi:hypothetical protein
VARIIDRHPAQSPLVKYYVVLYNTVLFFGWYFRFELPLSVFI